MRTVEHLSCDGWRLTGWRGGAAGGASFENSQTGYTVLVEALYVAGPPNLSLHPPGGQQSIVVLKKN